MASVMGRHFLPSSAKNVNALYKNIMRNGYTNSRDTIPKVCSFGQRTPGGTGSGMFSPLTSASIYGLHTMVRPQSRLYVTDTDLTQNCWKCGTEIDASTEQYFCECGVIQPPVEHRTLFDVLGIDESFELDLQQLTQRFRNLQKKLHPDKFTNKPEEEKAYSLLQSTMVNKAYKTLQKPLTRGLYLLELNGHSLEEGETQSDPEFLMEIMETNEIVIETESLDILRQLDDVNRNVLIALYSQVSDAFHQQNYAEAKNLLSRLKYYDNINEKIQAAQEKISCHT